MKYIIVLLFVISNIASSKQESNTSKLGADGGYLQIHTFYRLLNQFGIQVKDGVSDRKVDWVQNPNKLSIRAASGLQLKSVYGGLDAVTGGRLYLNGSFTWDLPDGSHYEFKNLQLQPTQQALKTGDLVVMDVLDANGQVLFYLNNIHAGFDQNMTQIFFENMDLRISPYLAKQINQPNLADHVAGHAHMYSNLIIPADYKAQEIPLGACNAGDNWPPANPDVDVALIGMDEVEYLGDFDDSHVIITPSATLENVGTADVAWWRKFTGNNPPYDNDQHPYLVWNMYREIDNRFEQIGRSGVKHAFFTVNTSCPCPGGQILFPTCRDKYSVGNNDSSSHLGPRTNVSAFAGLWESTGSFFDQDGNGVQDTSSDGLGQNRMVVAESDFADSNLKYYISSWYVIRDDVNIFNNMGFRQVNLTANGTGWNINSTPGSLFDQGSASSAYVSPNPANHSNGEASQMITRANEGHLTVAIKVIDNKDGTYRYNYMIENHDYDPQVQTITLPLPSSSSMTDFVFSDLDEDNSNNWSVMHLNNRLVLQAPVANAIDWGTLYSFSFTTDSVPQAGNVRLAGLENGGAEFDVMVITPFFDDLIFENGFDILN